MPDTASIDLKTLLQLVGALDDSDDPNGASNRFRGFLAANVRNGEALREYVDVCLETSGDQYNKALQDIVNHIGRLLGFEIEFGRYRGVPGQTGNDGLWKSPNGKFVVVEVKTTDVYTVKTDTLLGYINQLISSRRIPDMASALGLYVYGRPTAEISQLEHAIIAEKRQNELRVISSNSLLNLLELYQDYDLDHAAVLDLILPHHVRIDHLVGLIYNIISQEKAQPVEQLVKASPADTTSPSDQSAVSYYLLPANDSEDGTPVEKNLHRWLDKGLWGLGQRTAYRKDMKSGDKVCFYAAHVRGIVARAELAGGSATLQQKDNPGKADTPFGIRLKNISWFKKPIKLDLDLRMKLAHFRGRDPDASWAWFVQGTKRLTAEDYALLTTE